MGKNSITNLKDPITNLKDPLSLIGPSQIIMPLWRQITKNMSMIG